MTNPLLSLESCTLSFGGLTAVNDLSFSLGENELTGIIGPNGAGKTSVFNIITGVYRPVRGEVRFNGASCLGLRPFRVTALGIARTFQNIRLFRSLTVLENVCVSFNGRLKNGIFHAVARGRKFAAQERQFAEEGMRLLKIFGIDSRAHRPCDSLSYGDQRRLEIVRALATQPKLLMLDEPAAGMNLTEKTELMRLIEFVHKEFGLAILLVEHDMRVVMGVCRRILVLNQGRLLADGSPAQIRSEPAVIEAYLGPHAHQTHI